MTRCAFSRLAALALAFYSVAPVSAAAPATFKVGELAFTRPAAWEWIEVTSPMRKAQLRVTDPATKETADVSFFDFGPGPGSPQANVDRWINQFEESRDKLKPQISETTIGGRKVTYVQAQGTYKGAMPGGPPKSTPHYGLMAAIIEGKDSNVFVKLTGPAALTEKATADFKKMVESSVK